MGRRNGVEELLDAYPASRSGCGRTQESELASLLEWDALAIPISTRPPIDRGAAAGVMLADPPDGAWPHLAKLLKRFLFTF